MPEIGGQQSGNFNQNFFHNNKIHDKTNGKRRKLFRLVRLHKEVGKPPKDKMVKSATIKKEI